MTYARSPQGCREECRQQDLLGIRHRYFLAKACVSEAGYRDEIKWQGERCSQSPSEAEFLRQAGWVIFCSGMREAVIRVKFRALSEAFCGWSSGKEIWMNRGRCFSAASRVFNHKGKIQALLVIAGYISRYGYQGVRFRLLSEGHHALERFPYLGPATSRHLAKNLGIEVAKPDRHLTRIAAALGYASVDSLCEELARLTGDRGSVVDIVLWRFATIRSDYLQQLCAATA